MLLKIAFPLIDQRPFLENHTYQIQVPSWPEPYYEEFVRHFGPIQYSIDTANPRRQVPYCQSKNAVKLHQFNHYSFLPAELAVLTGAPFPRRRLYVYSRSSYKANLNFSNEARFDFEIFLKPKATQAFDLPHLIPSEKSLLNTVKRFIDFPVKVASFSKRSNTSGTSADKKVETALWRAGTHLSNLYLHSSTKVEERERLKNFWVSSGLPILIIKLFQDPARSAPFQEMLEKLKVVEHIDQDNITLIHTWYEADRNLLPTWVIVQNSRQANIHHTIEALEKKILRFHVEYEGLKQVLRQVLSNRLAFQPRSPASQRFQFYINTTIHQLNERKKRDYTLQQVFKEMTSHHFEFLTEQECDQLIQQLDHIRKNILIQLDHFNRYKSTRPDSNQLAPVDQKVAGLSELQLSSSKMARLKELVQQKSWAVFCKHLILEIGKGNTEDVLKYLLGYFLITGEQGQPLIEVTLKMSRFNRIEETNRKGNMTIDEYNTNRNKLDSSILDFLQQPYEPVQV